MHLAATTLNYANTAENKIKILDEEWFEAPLSPKTKKNKKTKIGAVKTGNKTNLLKWGLIIKKKFEEWGL